MADAPTTILRYVEQRQRLLALLDRGTFLPDARIVALLMLAFLNRRLNP